MSLLLPQGYSSFKNNCCYYNGNRLETYIIVTYEPGIICLKGAAALLACLGEIIVSYYIEGSDFMKTVKLITFFTIVIFIMSSCSSNDFDELTLSDVIEIANARRQNIPPINEDKLMRMIEGRDTQHFSVDDWVKLHARPEDVPFRIRYTYAIYDTITLFNVLRYVYGPYNYFGGDSVFFPIRDSIIKELQSQEYWGLQVFAALLYGRLSEVIKDNHAKFNMRIFSTTYRFFVNDVRFTKTINGFLHLESGQYLREVQGHHKYDIMRLSMDYDGNFFFVPIILKDINEFNNNSYNMNFILEDNTNISSVLWLQAPPTERPFENVSMHLNNNIPIITIMQMGSLHPRLQTHADKLLYGVENAKKFLYLTEVIKYAPVVIIDIRYNMGGNTVLPLLWLRMILEETPGNHATRIFSNKFYTYFEDLEKIWAELVDEFDGIDQLLVNKPLGDYHIISTSVTNQVVTSENLIILLTSRATKSAAELFIDHILNIENTLIIGQNTYGTMLTPSATPLYLPKSGITFQLAPSVNVFCKTQFQEGIGFEPDIWVTGDALKATLAMLNRWLE